MTSAAVSDYLGRSYFPAFGVPKSIVTDNAKDFCCKEFKDLCFNWRVEHLTTTPYYPQASLAERVNSNLKAPLKIFHHESQNTWDENLPWLGLAFNTAVHESTRYTPDVLFLGRELKCPWAVRWDLSPGSDVDNVCDTNQFWTRACGNLLAARKRVAQRFNEGPLTERGSRRLVTYPSNPHLLLALWTSLQEERRTAVR